jgi:hypothetical protein
MCPTKRKKPIPILENEVASKKQILSPRDLPDFLLRWQEFRNCVVEVAELKALSHDQQELVVWLIKMADRVGQQDLA